MAVSGVNSVAAVAVRTVRRIDDLNHPELRSDSPPAAMLTDATRTSRPEPGTAPTTVWM
jgi:hypothetical protein